MGILKHIPEQITDRVPKVYFSCHKDDFDLCFEAIKKEITKGRNCAVFYDADYDGARDKEFLFDLSNMHLFVMPITKRLLTKSNRALGEELAFALEHGIPVLPLMLESGLEELYKQKFGDLQFLDKNSRELGAISYEEKLDKYLSSILLNDETIKRIREEFDAQIFLSYRKKDRIHANRLMRLIHKNDFCRDIAIWYDEFLTPGENFNDNIRKALDKSGLFVLAVTPSLLEPRIDEEGIEHKNYIEEHEYPMAKERESEGKIAILPAELVKTDSVLLSQKYENIPDCVDSDDENALTEALLNTAKKLVNDENDNSPEHNYLIGLAYLNGIDVEVDHARAREMIEFAANADYLEAIDKMIEMYKDGIGTERNYETAIQWHERKITLLQKRYYDDDSNYENILELLETISNCGLLYKDIGEVELSQAKYFEALSISERHVLLSEAVQRERAYCYVEIAELCVEKSAIEAAKKYAKTAFDICKQLLNNNPDVENRWALIGTAKYIAHLHGSPMVTAVDYDTAKKYLNIALEQLDALEYMLEQEESQVPRKVIRSKSDTLLMLGNIYENEDEIDIAEKYYTAALHEWSNISIFRNEFSMGEIHLFLARVLEKKDIDAAERHIKKAIRIFRNILKTYKQETRTKNEIKSKLFVSYRLLADIYEKRGEKLAAEKNRKLSIKILRGTLMPWEVKVTSEEKTLASETTHAILPAEFISNIKSKYTTPTAMKRVYSGDIDISKRIIDFMFETKRQETELSESELSALCIHFVTLLIISIEEERRGGDFAHRVSKADCYREIGDIYRTNQMYENAKRYYILANEHFVAINNECDNIETKKDLAQSYDLLGHTFYHLNENEAAGDNYEKASRIIREIAELENTNEGWFEFSISLCKLVVFSCQVKEKREYLQKALNIMNALCEQCPDIAIYKEHRDGIQSELDKLDEDETE